METKHATILALFVLGILALVGRVRGVGLGSGEPTDTYAFTFCDLPAPPRWVVRLVGLVLILVGAALCFLWK